MITIATWNVAWTGRRSKHFAAVRERIRAMDADILVLTETMLDAVPGDGHLAEGGRDWGYPIHEGRRKVVLWSRWPLDALTADALVPAGRHVAATVQTPFGPVRVHGVCVPWSHAHVTGGRRDRGPWEEHVDHLAALDALLTRGARPSGPGRRGRRRQPARHRAFERAGACTRCLGQRARAAEVFEPDGLSDHHAVLARVENTDRDQPPNLTRPQSSLPVSSQP